jgi:apolipoprotein D and lipocalin family protein
MKTTLISFLSLMMSPFSVSCASASTASEPEVRTVDYVNLERYAGLWHQIAFYPTRFQGDCTIDTTATYTLRPDGKVGVLNECTKTNGKRKSIEGKARIVDEKTQAKLKVKFFWFAPAGDYWIIDLGPNYEYAVVGTPNRKYLWILSRTPTMDRVTYEKILERIQAQAFDIGKIQITSKISE